MTVRPAMLADNGAITALTAELGYPADPATIRARLGSVLATTWNAVFVADDADMVVGWLHVFLRPLLESDLAAEIGGLVVAPDARRRGAGRQLIAAAEAWAGARGAARLTVRCRVERDDGNRFYEALGFRTAKTQNVWRKPLGDPAS